MALKKSRIILEIIWDDARGEPSDWNWTRLVECNKEGECVNVVQVTSIDVAERQPIEHEHLRLPDGEGSET